MTTVPYNPTGGEPYMRKTLALGTVPGASFGYKARLPVEIEVEISDGRLSICGSIWKPRRGDIVSGGQNYDEIARLFPKNAKVQRIVEVWKRWHLNDARAGCEHQRAEGWGNRPIDPSKPLDTYGQHVEGSQSWTWNMLAWVRPDEHPDGLLTAPCPTCGYKYGTAWLVEELPAEIIAEVEAW